MRNFLTIILSISLFVMCSDPRPTENVNEIDNPPVMNNIVITGMVFSDYFDFPMSYIEVTLDGKKTYKDTTNVEGDFILELSDTGQYNLTIKDSLHSFVDSTIYVASDTNFNLNLTALYEDYFPLKAGNLWTFSYDYRPCSYDHYYQRQEGIMTWKVQSRTSAPGGSKYLLEETIDGIKMNWTQDYNIDTVVVKRQRLLSFHYDHNGFITINGNNYFGSILFMVMNKFYRNTSNTIFLQSQYSDWDIRDNNLSIINSFECGYRVKLVKNVGISELLINNWSNCSPRGSFILTDYEIK